MPDEPTSITLENAYLWECPACGHTNFVRHYIREIEPPPEPFTIDGTTFTMGCFEAGPRCGSHLACHKCERVFPRHIEPLIEGDPHA